MFAVQSIGAALFFTGLQKKNPENNAATYYNAVSYTHLDVYKRQTII